MWRRNGLWYLNVDGIVVVYTDRYEALADYWKYSNEGGVIR